MKYVGVTDLYVQRAPGQWWHHNDTQSVKILKYKLIKIAKGKNVRSFWTVSLLGQTFILCEMIFAYNTVMSVLGIEDMWVTHDHQLV